MFSLVHFHLKPQWVTPPRGPGLSQLQCLGRGPRSQASGSETPEAQLLKEGLGVREEGRPGCTWGSPEAGWMRDFHDPGQRSDMPPVLLRHFLICERSAHYILCILFLNDFIFKQFYMNIGRKRQGLLGHCSDVFQYGCQTNTPLRPCFGP